MSMENPVEKLEALQLSVTVDNSNSVEMSESAENSGHAEVSEPARNTGETSSSAGSAEAAGPVKIAKSFQTVQEKVDSWTSDADGLVLGLFRLDPPKPMGQLLTVHLSLVYKGINSKMPLQLTVEDRTQLLDSVFRMMNRLLGMPDTVWSREHHQFSHYTDLLTKLRENTCMLLYSYTGTLVSIPMFCRVPEEADEVWQRYNSGELERELREEVRAMYLPFGPVEPTVKIYDYDECKRNFQFSGYRLLYIMYPHINRKRYY